MNTVHTETRHTHSPMQPAVSARQFDWVGQIKLAIVLSVVAACTAIALAGHVPEPVVIVGVIVVASVAGWARVQPVAQPARLPVRRP